jgi:cytochrome P450
MTLYPEAQHKAQEEIDRVIGCKRLPSSEDRENLPYINALVKEVFRWHPVAPIGVPHMTTEDDIFNGYLIPKGAIILPNIGYAPISLFQFTYNSLSLRSFPRARNVSISPSLLHANTVNRCMSQDPNMFHDPSAFKPERFLGCKDHEPEPDPDMVVFGFGRRKCPGRVLADTSVYLTIAKSLAVFNVSKAVENGKEIEPVVEFTPGALVSHPFPYKTSIKPRSPEHEALIRSVLVEYPWEEGDSKFL